MPTACEKITPLFAVIFMYILAGIIRMLQRVKEGFKKKILLRVVTLPASKEKGRKNRVIQEGSGAGDTGGKWCGNCQTTTHNTSSCWGEFFNCGLFGHKAAQCKNPKRELPGAGGALKKLEPGVGVE